MRGDTNKDRRPRRPAIAAAPGAGRGGRGNGSVARGAGGGGQARPNVKMGRHPMPIDELVVDGASGLIARAGVAKIDLFRVVGYEPESKAERRQVSHRLVRPQAVLPELYNLL